MKTPDDALYGGPSYEVPLHWREQVKRDIGVQRGVLEKIPQGFLIPGVCDHSEEG